MESTDTLHRLLCLGSSQWPILRDGDEIEIQSVGVSTLRVSDLVVFRSGNLQVCHRILYKKRMGGGAWFYLKGDAKARADGWITASTIQGKVVRVKGYSASSLAFRIVSTWLYLCSVLQDVSFRAMFHSHFGKVAGQIRALIFPQPIFMNLFILVTTPSMWFHKGLRNELKWSGTLPKIRFSLPAWVNRWRRELGQVIFNRWIVPPRKPSRFLVPFAGDYGHGFYYDEIFCRGETDVQDIDTLCANTEGAILDLAGGAGRLACRLAAGGKQVILIDRSATMLGIARGRSAELPLRTQANLQIIKQDIRSLSMSRLFRTIISLRNVLEHLPDEPGILETLGRIGKHLEEGGVFFADVHFEPFWQKTPQWKTGKWVYEADLRCDGRRMRVWGRTRRDHLTHALVWEHAVSSNLVRYTLLSTRLIILPVWRWIWFFRNSGFRVADVWGNWRGAAVGSAHPKVIFKLVGSGF